MKNQITFLILLCVLGLRTLQAQVTQEWVRIYSGPGNTNDAASSIAVDNSGNVYVTGTRRTGSGAIIDYATIKYNSTGYQEWVRTLNGPINSYGESSLAVDGAGNVYVTGASTGIGNSDYGTIKYNSSGDSLWVARYNGPGNSYDGSYAIAVDGSGNVYVTGQSAFSGNSSDYATIKYNSSGDSLWVRRYDGSPIDYATSIAIDDSGNVYVTGMSFGIGYPEFATIKYNSSGVQQWVQRYGPVYIKAELILIAVDDSGNVYVTGTGGTSAPRAYVTIKYNSSGAQQWVQIYDGPGNGNDFVGSLAVDHSGNVYVTGSSWNDVTRSDCATIKYNSSGDSLWVARYNGPANSFDGASSLAVDESGNVYVSGSSNGIGGPDYATIKYNSSGDQQWVQTYNGPGNGSDHASSLTIDGAGNVYVTGSSVGIGTFMDYATIKYSQLTGILQANNSIPENFSLSQNYPNPFNPVTVIRYSLIENRFATLKVYDILGNEITTLVNEKQNAGTYEVDFDGSNYSSGVYFYKLVVEGNIIDTKQMVLLK